jgi:hypothetical protein
MVFRHAVSAGLAPALAFALAVGAIMTGSAGSEAASLARPAPVVENMAVRAQSSESQRGTGKTDRKAPQRIVPSGPGSVPLSQPPGGLPGVRPESREAPAAPDQGVPHRLPPCGVGPSLPPCKDKI